jgi:hypothetical protein
MQAHVCVSLLPVPAVVSEAMLAMYPTGEARKGRIGWLQLEAVICTKLVARM